MRTQAQIDTMMEVMLAGGTKKDALIAGGYSPRSARSNGTRTFGRGHFRYTLFVEGLFQLRWNQSAAARYAGYSPRWAGTNASRLMRHPAVQEEIRRRRRALRIRLGMPPEPDCWR